MALKVANEIDLYRVQLFRGFIPQAGKGLHRGRDSGRTNQEIEILESAQTEFAVGPACKNRPIERDCRDTIFLQGVHDPRKLAEQGAISQSGLFQGGAKCIQYLVRHEVGRDACQRSPDQPRQVVINGLIYETRPIVKVCQQLPNCGDFLFRRRDLGTGHQELEFGRPQCPSFHSGQPHRILSRC